MQLEQAGYSTVSQALDFRPGQDFVRAMQVAVTSATRTIAVLSPAYFESRFGEAEWRVAFQADPSGERGLLVPVRVQPCTPPGLLAARVYVDLVDLDEHAARERLLAAVGPPPSRPATAPFPGAPPAGASGPTGAGGVSRFPGAGPTVSNLPGRNRHFSGRDGQLTTLHGRMRAAAIAAVLPLEAVHGLGGVGKTELRARTQYERALQIIEAAHGPDHPTIGTVRSNLGGVLHNLGDLPGARTQYERALQIREAAHGPDHPQALQVRRNRDGVV